MTGDAQMRPKRNSNVWQSFRAKTCVKVLGTQVLKSNNDYTKVKSSVPLHLYSPDFCHLLNDIWYIRATGLYENANRFLWIMWTPTSSSTLSNSFAGTRFSLLNSYVSTHAKLPSEECFLPWEKDKINHLAFKWIGNTPLQRDVEHIAYFVRDLDDLFLHSKKGKSLSDPIERKKVEAESQFLTGLLETIRPKCSIQPVESRHKLSIQGMEQENSCVPFQWEDLCKQWNVSIKEAPDGHQFLYNGRVFKMRERSAAVAEGSPQEGYCYSKAYPNSELKLDPNLIRNSSSTFSCGQYHRLTRAKFRALKYVRCHYPRAKCIVCPLRSEPEDLQYEGLVCQLPKHKYSAWSLHERSSRLYDPLILRPFPRWLSYDPRTEPLTVDPPRPCPPSLSNPNRRAFEVNPHIPFHPPILKPCSVYKKTRTHADAKKTRDANVSNTCRRQQPTKLPPILFDRLKLQRILWQTP
ncbi:conserved hypothetical protein [Echinococcus multilocularis]|uniref:Uncharacterized protein n=1 Tax=Echinococcus multilocularis TaxID=6211 RepID=A0A068YJ31_ECHMU|nr:conserved hypothetical protein [Echinococcus multilocularis]